MVQSQRYMKWITKTCLYAVYRTTRPHISFTHETLIMILMHLLGVTVLSLDTQLLFDAYLPCKHSANALTDANHHGNESLFTSLHGTCPS